MFAALIFALATLLTSALHPLQTLTGQAHRTPSGPSTATAQSDSRKLPTVQQGQTTDNPLYEDDADRLPSWAAPSPGTSRDRPQGTVAPITPPQLHETQGTAHDQGDATLGQASPPRDTLHQASEQPSSSAFAPQQRPPRLPRRSSDSSLGGSVSSFGSSSGNGYSASDTRPLQQAVPVGHIQEGFGQLRRRYLTEPPSQCRVTAVSIQMGHLAR